MESRKMVMDLSHIAGQKIGDAGVENGLWTQQGKEWG